jgi:chorismate synthase
VTLGSPLVLMIPNKDNTLEKLGPLTELRPGHADLAGCLKYGTNDARNVLERASARETAARVMVGAVAAQVLLAFGVECFGHVRSVGAVKSNSPDLSLGVPGAGGLSALRAARDASPFYCVDIDASAAMRQAVDAARRAGDTLGGVVEVVIFNAPPGIGNGTQWDRKLDGRIAQACMSVQAIKGVEFGMGMASATRMGSETHDPIELQDHGHPASASYPASLSTTLGAATGTFATHSGAPNPNNPSGLTRPSNRAGGIEGGMSNGMPIVVRCAMKPIATLMRPLATVDLATGLSADAAKERSDICAVPAASVVLESAVAVPVCAAMLEKFGGDSIGEALRNFRGYLEQLHGTLPGGRGGGTESPAKGTP